MQTATQLAEAPRQGRRAGRRGSHQQHPPLAQHLGTPAAAQTAQVHGVSGEGSTWPRKRLMPGGGRGVARPHAPPDRHPYRRPRPRRGGVHQTIDGSGTTVSTATATEEAAASDESRRRVCLATPAEGSVPPADACVGCMQAEVRPSAAPAIPAGSRHARGWRARKPRGSQIRRIGTSSAHASIENVLEYIFGDRREEGFRLRLDGRQTRSADRFSRSCRWRNDCYCSMWRRDDCS